jgi:predicted dehydrogenase
MLGCGFMGRAHSNAYNQVNHFFSSLETRPILQAVYSRDEKRAQDFADTWGYASIETDWKRLIGRDDIDLIDVCTPNHLHHDQVIAAAEAGKIVCCEKPLAMNTAEGEAMVAAVEKAGVANMVWFNYRRVPAIALFKQVIEEDRVGKPFHYRATYNQDFTISTDVPQGGRALWRLDSNVAGSGVTGDLLAHSIDSAEWLNGPIRKVVAHTETFIKERKHAETGQMQKVDIDDACMFLAIFENGSIGTFESTRYARGRKNYSTMEINGANGALYFNLEEPEYIEYFRYADPDGNKIEDHLTGWQRILVTNFEHPYMDKFWVPGTMIGYEHTFICALADFLDAQENGKPFQPDMKTALRTQKVCDGVLESAAKGTWIEL